MHKKKGWYLKHVRRCNVKKSTTIMNA
jgi:hypothetical protein